jgi:hypothetical protein
VSSGAFELIGMVFKTNEKKVPHNRLSESQLADQFIADIVNHFPTLPKTKKPNYWVAKAFS